MKENYKVPRLKGVNQERHDKKIKNLIVYINSVADDINAYKNIRKEFRRYCIISTGTPRFSRIAFMKWSKYLGANIKTDIKFIYPEEEVVKVVHDHSGNTPIVAITIITFIAAIAIAFGIV